MSFTLHDAERALVRIGSAALRADIDTAQREERELFRRALHAIEHGCRNPQLMAATALKSLDLVFDR